MKKRNWRLTLALSMLLLLALLPTMAFAAGKIDLTKDVSFSISYQDGEIPIPGAQFDLYRIADTDETAHMTAAAEYKPLIDVDLNTLEQEDWVELAKQLKGEAQLSHKAAASAKTDAQGIAAMTVKPGLYLVVGSSVTVDDVTYVTDPFMTFLPWEDKEAGDWSYEVTAQPKHTQPYAIRKLLKIWDADHPSAWADQTEVLVDILCDGKLMQTVALQKANNWRYSWTEELDPAHEHDWAFVEHPVKGFTPVYALEGTTYTITNLYDAQEELRDIEIEKKISGSPTTKSEFKFTLKAAKTTYPMPKDSKNGSKTISITGAGKSKFGEIQFSAPGDYVYTVSEEKGSVSGYTYDSTVYTITFTVIEEDGDLKVNAKAKNSQGKAVEALVFTNKYSTGGGGGGGGGDLPQTGLLWWPVPVLAIVGLMLMIFGIAHVRAGRDE